MDKNTAQQMAEESGLSWLTTMDYGNQLLKFAELVAKTEREKMQADTLRMNYLERQAIGRCSEVNGPDVFMVTFTLIEPERKTLREAVDAAMASMNCGTLPKNCGTS